MYTLHIKENRPQLEITLFRALLAFAALTSLVLKTNSNYLINVVAALLLFCSAVFIEFLLVKLSMRKFVLLIVASIIILVATHYILYSLIFLIVGLLSSNFNQSSQIFISRDLIQLKKGFLKNTYHWNEFSNIILKDELITMDFINNRLIQLMIDEKATKIKEAEFNQFCSGLLISNQLSTDLS
jgi:hypothetical protein